MHRKLRLLQLNDQHTSKKTDNLVIVNNVSCHENTTWSNFIFKNDELDGFVLGSAGNRPCSVGRGSQCEFLQPKRGSSS